MPKGRTSKLKPCDNCGEKFQYEDDYPVCYKCRSLQRRREQEGLMPRHINGRFTKMDIEAQRRLDILDLVQE